MKKQVILGIAMLAVSAWAGVLWAQLPAGPDFEVIGGQSGTLASHPAVAKAPNGEFLVVWKWLLSPTGDSHGIYGRLFDAKGQGLARKSHQATKKGCPHVI